MSLRKIRALALALCAGTVVQTGAQVTPVPGVAPPKIGANATIQGTQAAIRGSKQDPAAVSRGNTLFVANCGYCHGATAKGTDIGPDLIRSVIVLNDDKGELLFPKVRNHSNKTAIAPGLTDAQLSDIDAWLKVQFYGVAMRATYDYLNIVVGDAKKGEAFFNGAGKCGTCHSVTGDLAGIGGKADPPTLQSRWISGLPVVFPGAAMAPGRGGAGRGPGSAPGGGDPGSTIFDEAPPVILPYIPTETVTFENGQTLEGVDRGSNEFYIVIKDMQGAYHSWPKVGDFPKVTVHNPRQAHFDLIRTLTDDDMHNVTAYLVTLK